MLILQNNELIIYFVIIFLKVDDKAYHKKVFASN